MKIFVLDLHTHDITRSSVTFPVKLRSFQLKLNQVHKFLFYLLLRGNFSFISTLPTGSAIAPHGTIRRGLFKQHVALRETDKPRSISICRATGSRCILFSFSSFLFLARTRARWLVYRKPNATK